MFGRNGSCQRISVVAQNPGADGSPKASEADGSCDMLRAHEYTNGGVRRPEKGKAQGSTGGRSLGRQATACRRGQNPEADSECPRLAVKSGWDYIQCTGRSITRLKPSRRTFGRTAGGRGRAETFAPPVGRIKTAKGEEPQERRRGGTTLARPRDLAHGRKRREVAVRRAAMPKGSVARDTEIHVGIGCRSGWAVLGGKPQGQTL